MPPTVISLPICPGMQFSPKKTTNQGSISELRDKDNQPISNGSSRAAELSQNEVVTSVLQFMQPC